ncbi:pyridoxamine 5'-phosphate oxidase family protein [Nesterenkonia populi]|uniref:pyridoxamine 5'-phosphate oxidase family protein n=1 Tax=Nesterenkonia populi TaxID=1591087 RepID=UPI0011BF5EE7|nr:pyridoxamine 5'-phosphate oxidase family protein [Nesterenkonia populi]
MLFDHPNQNPVLTLAEDQSWQLLSTAELGRLVLVVSGRPDIFPVNFAVQDRTIVFRTAPGTKLAELTVNDQIVFEADAVLPEEGWSVIVRGTAEQLQTSDELAAAEALGLETIVPTVKEHYVRVTPTEITGRHFLRGPAPEADPGSGSNAS